MNKFIVVGPMVNMQKIKSSISLFSFCFCYTIHILEKLMFLQQTVMFGYEPSCEELLGTVCFLKLYLAHHTNLEKINHDF